MNVIDDTVEPRALRQIDLRNAALRGKWAEKFHSLGCRGYEDQRANPRTVDESLARKLRLAKHMVNALKQKKKHKAPSNVVSMFHRLQAS